MEINVPETENPMGLFSPTTGLGWESYINTRLENELKRAISSEIDLSIFIIKLQNISRSDELFRDLCDYLSILFQFKDLLFEYKDDCILCIKLSMNVDEALAFADKIHVDLSSKINRQNINSINNYNSLYNAVDQISDDLEELLILLRK